MIREFYRDNWNDEDHQVIDPAELSDLEGQVANLKEELQSYKDDELFVLYHLMDLRDSMKGCAPPRVRMELGEIIKTHSAALIKRAKLYTRRGEEWDYD
jgi:hypothetical protein